MGNEHGSNSHLRNHWPTWMGVGYTAGYLELVAEVPPTRDQRGMRHNSCVGTHTRFLSMDQVFEGTPEATIELAGRKVTRSEVTGDWGSRLQWEVRHNGEVIATPAARAEVAYEHPEPKPGKYEIVLQMWKYEGYKSGSQGQYIPISNSVTYTV